MAHRIKKSPRIGVPAREANKRRYLANGVKRNEPNVQREQANLAFMVEHGVTAQTKTVWRNGKKIVKNESPSESVRRWKRENNFQD